MKVKSASRYLSSFMLSFTAVVLSCVFGVTSASAEARSCVVNDVEMNTGDVFTYTLNITEPSEKISGVGVSVYYDPECLSIIPDKLSLPVFTNALCNHELDGEIRFNAIDVSNGFDLTQGGVAIAVPFEILDGVEETNITFVISEMYGYESDDELTDYETDVTIELGTPQEVVSPQNIEEIEAEVSQREQEREQQLANETNTFWIIVGVCTGAVVVVAALVLYVRYKRKTQRND